jgi:hypothetical protein
MKPKIKEKYLTPLPHQKCLTPLPPSPKGEGAFLPYLFQEQNANKSSPPPSQRDKEK